MILISNVDAAYARAVGYSRSIRPSTLAAVTTDPSVHAACKRLAPEVDVQLLQPPGRVRQRLKRYLDARRAQLSQDDFLTVMVPEILERGSLVEVLRRPRLHRLKDGS